MHRDHRPRSRLSGRDCRGLLAEYGRRQKQLVGGSGIQLPDGGGEVTVENTQQHRLDLIIVNKIRGDGHNDIQSEDGETYNIKFEPYQFDMANKAIQNKFILKDIFDGVDLKTANMIGEMAYAFAEYVSAILYALSDENNSSRYLKQ